MQSAVCAALGLAPSLALADLCATGAVQDFLPAHPPETCGIARAEDGTLEDHCAWRFDAGSREAEQRFADLGNALSACAAAAPADQRVNHPDSYDLLVFKTEKGRISLSLKEKYALQARYIFIRKTR